MDKSGVFSNHYPEFNLDKEREMDKSGVLLRKQGKTCDTSSAATSLQVPHRLTRAR
jgi:hypothetical protein